MTTNKPEKQTEKELAKNTTECIKVAATGGSWRELLPRKSAFGTSDFMVYITDRKYEIVRYNRTVDSVDTVLTGIFWDCSTDEERFNFILEDFQSLLETLKADYEDRHRPDTELEEDIKLRDRLYRYDY
jgi:hypothetical protein